LCHPVYAFLRGAGKTSFLTSTYRQTSNSHNQFILKTADVPTLRATNKSLPSKIFSAVTYIFMQTQTKAIAAPQKTPCTYIMVIPLLSPKQNCCTNMSQGHTASIF